MKFSNILTIAGVAYSQCSSLSQAECKLEGGASGTVKLERKVCRGKEHVAITGLINCANCAAGDHGFHIHGSGKIKNENDQLDCGLTGGHFSTGEQKHGAPWDNNRHYGALGNIEIENGSHNLDITDSIISLNPTSDSYIGGRGMVLHAGQDDYTGASGHAGPRVACCTITHPQL